MAAPCCTQVDALKPGLLGRDRFEFATLYCARRCVPVPGSAGMLRYNNNGLSRAAELHLLLREEVRCRRGKPALAELSSDGSSAWGCGWAGLPCKGPGCHEMLPREMSGCVWALQVMLRRLKKDVLSQLPPKRRQVGTGC